MEITSKNFFLYKDGDIAYPYGMHLCICRTDDYTYYALRECSSIGGWHLEEDEEILAYCILEEQKTDLIIETLIEEDKNDNSAVELAQDMMRMPQSDIPSGAAAYAKYLSEKVGASSEVYMTAYAYYNQAVIGCGCTDEAYKIPDKERQWFIDNFYCAPF